MWVAGPSAAAAQVTAAPAAPTQEAAPAPSSSPKSVEEALGLTKAQRVLVQRGLTALGFDVGAADGIFGTRSRAGIGKWQSSRGESATGYLDAEASETLLKAGEAVPPEPPGRVVREAMELLSEALSIARSIEYAPFRATALGVIAEAQASAGDTRGAAQTVSEALSIARSHQVASSRASALSSIARAQARAGDTRGAQRTITEALRSARGVENARSLSAIAKAQASVGDMPGAQRTISEALPIARSGEGADGRAMALSSIAEAQARAGDARGAQRTISEALAIARSVEDAAWRAVTLGVVAEAQARVGDTRGAQRTVSETLYIAQNFPTSALRARALGAIAMAQATIGDTQGASVTARSIGRDSHRALTFIRIVADQVTIGNYQGALVIAQNIESEFGRPESDTGATKKATASSSLTVKTIDYANGHYYGQTLRGEAHGRGVFTFPHGTRYEGDFRHGSFQGRGGMTWPSGSRYEGDFVDGERTGRGVMTWPNGNRYEGDFVDGKRTGRGVLTSPDGKRWEGNFVDGKRTGRGTWTQPGAQAWGATAVETDPAGGPRYKVCDERGFAISVNFEGPAEAGDDARAQCSARSGDCDVKRYFDECAAFAQGYMDYADGGRYCVYGLGVGDSRNSASARAMDVCRSDALQPLVSGLGLTHLEHTDKVYGCEIRSTACNSITELRKRQQQVTQRVESQRQRQQPVQTTDSGGWVAVTDGYRNGRGEGGVVGVAAGRRSRSDALRAAMRDCENSGGVSCGQRSGKDAWEERCIAVAEASWMGEDEMFFNGTGDTRSEAEDEAESYCRRAGATGCFITESECG